MLQLELALDPKLACLHSIVGASANPTAFAQCRCTA